MTRTIVCFGDSNTHGTTPMADLDDRGRLGAAERWPGVVADRLGSGWRVVDVQLKGAYSELATRRSEYSSILRRSGLAELLAVIDAKIASACFETCRLFVIEGEGDGHF